MKLKHKLFLYFLLIILYLLINFSYQQDYTTLDTHRIWSSSRFNSLTDLVMSQTFGNYIDEWYPPMIYITAYLILPFNDTFNFDFHIIFFHILGIIFLISFFYIISKYYGTDVALIGTFLILTNPGHLYYNIGIEAMNLFLIGSIWTFYFMKKSLKDNKTSSLLLFVLFLSLTVWTYLASIFIVAGVFLYLIIDRKRRHFFKKNLIYVFLFLIMITPIFHTYFNAILTPSRPDEIYSNQNFYSSIFLPLSQDYVFEIIFVIFLVIGIIFGFKFKHKNSFFFITLIIFLINLLHILNSSTYNPRYTISFSWMFYVLFGQSFYYFRKIKNKIPYLILIVLFIGSFLIPFISYFSANWNDDRLHYLSYDNFKNEDKMFIYINDDIVNKSSENEFMIKNLLYWFKDDLNEFVDLYTKIHYGDISAIDNNDKFRLFSIEKLNNFNYTSFVLVSYGKIYLDTNFNISCIEKGKLNLLWSDNYYAHRCNMTK